MPAIAPMFATRNGTYLGNGTLPLSPGSYIEHASSEALWWKYLSGSVAVATGVASVIVAVYMCVRKGKRHEVQPAPATPDDGFETPVLGDDPPPAYDAPYPAVEQQQALHEGEVNDAFERLRAEQPEPRAAVIGFS